MQLHILKLKHGIKIKSNFQMVLSKKDQFWFINLKIRCNLDRWKKQPKKLISGLVIGRLSIFFMTQKSAFLSKIQNRISGKTGRKIVLLSCKNSVKTQFLGVVEIPSILLIQFFKVVVLIPKFQGSGFFFQFLKNYHNLKKIQSDFEFCLGMLLPQK